MNKDTDKSWEELVEKENAVSNKVICDNTDEFGKDTESENEDVLQITENDVSDLIDDRTDAQRMEETAILPMSMENNEESVQHVANRNKTKMNSEDDPIMRKRLREDNLESLNEEVPRNRCNSTSSSSTSSGNGKKKVEFETDPGILARRQKDIDYGKNTIGYDKYIQAIPKKERTKEHPRTPPKYAKYSRRGWDGMVKLWRKQLHCWDPSEESSNIGEDKNLSPS